MKLVLQTKKSPIAGAKCELLIFTTETYMKRTRTLPNEIDLGQSNLKFSALKVASGYCFFIKYSLHFYCDISMTFINKVFLSSGGGKT